MSGNKSTLANLVLNFSMNSLNGSNESNKNDNKTKIKTEYKDNFLVQSNIPKTVTAMFKSAFEEMIKKNRIENFDNDQDFNEIRKKFSKEKPFTDLKFKTNNESIFFSNNFKEWLQHEGKLKNNQEIVWKRAKDISINAQFAVDDHGRSTTAQNLNESNYKNFFHITDLDQGCLGNCWFISAATGIIQNYTLFKRVVPFDNSFDNDSYTGAFHFRFWIFGTWKDVIIDDYLPVGSDNKLIFCKNKENSNEFWCALLEKAYSKICGSYEALEGGFTSDALIDMSGGVEESYILKDIRNTKKLNYSNHSNGSINTSISQIIDYKAFWEILDNAERKSSVIGCNIDSSDVTINSSGSFTSELRLPNGLVQGHAYIVTKIQRLEINEETYNLIQLYNPWGNDVEWRGDWSDSSSKWDLIDTETKTRLGVKDKKDGQFWMSYDDWLENFDHCQICNLTPESVCDISENDWQNQRLLSSIFSLWQCQYFNGKWIKGISAGGCGQFDQKNFFSNPQYGFILTKSDMIRNNSCWVIVALMQKYTRNKRKLQTKSLSCDEYIQYRLFKAKSVDIFSEHISNGKPLDNIHLERINSSGAYINKREITRRFCLEPGAYIIIPSTYDEGVEGEFLLRVFTEKPVNYKFFDETKIENKDKAFYSNNFNHQTIKETSESKEAIVNLIQFTDDYRKRNFENDEIDPIEEVKFRNREYNFSKRKSVIARRSNLCKQM